ncbi:MAG: hypothetical protein JNL67_19195 [Planctomycetaceae bacterium]|nr:hypothetical protein [Planctomycetaceae bacterium]
MNLRITCLCLLSLILTYVPSFSRADYLVADWGYGAVLRYSDSGEFLGEFAHGVHSVSLAIDGEGSVFIADQSARCIHWYTASGMFVTTLKCGIPNMRTIVFDKKLKCLYATRWDGGEIFKITLDGTVTLLINSDIPRLGQLAVSSDGRIYAPDIVRSQVRVFDTNGQDHGIFVNGYTMSAVCDSMDHVHLVLEDRVCSFNSQAHHLSSSDRSTSGWALAVNHQGDLLSLNSFNRIRRYSNSGVWMADINIPEAWFALDIVHVE